MSAQNTLQYLKFDFQSHKDALIQRVRSRWPTVWNDFLNNSLGIVLIDIVAWSTSTMAFMVNRIAGEMFVSSMTLRESAVRIGGNFGYQLRGPTPATVACEATLTSPQTALVTIAKGTLIRTSDASALPFEVAEDYYIQPGSLTPQTVAAQIAPGLVGPNTLATLAYVTNGTVNVDLADTSIDLTQYVQPGQVFQVTGDATQYVIEAVEAAPNAISNNRLVLATTFTGTTSAVTATIYEQRISLVQGQTVSDSFVAPTSTALNYSVLLSRSPVINQSVTVQVNNQVWSYVSSLAGSASSDLAFTVKTLTTGDTVVLFGDDVFGASIPTEGLIVVTYRTGGGSTGNVPLNSFRTSITALIQTTASPVTVAVANQTATGQGGQDAESLEQARVNIPYWVRTNDRAVTLDDYQTLCQQYSGPNGSVAYARATVRTENALLEGNIVSIYAWTTGAGGGLVPLEPQLKQTVTDYMQTKAVGTDYVQILDGEATPVPVSLRFMALSGFAVTDTLQLVNQAVIDMVNALRPGQTLVFSSFVGALDAVSGVSKLDIATPIRDLIPSSSIDLFTPPQTGFVYELDRNGVGSPVFSAADGFNISLYQAQLPINPLAAWSFELFLGTNQLTVVPGLQPGQALLLGPNLSVNTSQDSNGNYLYSSTVNLLTGQVLLWLVGAPGDLTMQLVPVAGYSTERSVNVYIGYIGDNSQTTRRAIRAAVRSWGDGMTIGGTMFAVPVPGVISSQSCIQNVAAAVSNVDSINRVALDTPNNTATSITAIDDELLVLGNIVINNNIDSVLAFLIPAGIIVGCCSMFMS